MPFSFVQQGETSSFFLLFLSLKPLFLFPKLWLYMLWKLPTHFATRDISHRHIHCVCAEGSAVIQPPDISIPLFPVNRAAGYDSTAFVWHPSSFLHLHCKTKVQPLSKEKWNIEENPLFNHFVCAALLDKHNLDIISLRTRLGHNVLLAKFKAALLAWIPQLNVSGKLQHYSSNWLL